MRADAGEGKDQGGDVVPGGSAEEQKAAAELLEKNGVDEAVARDLAARFTRERIDDCIALLDWRISVKRWIDSPGGFVRDALVKGWKIPQAVYAHATKASSVAKRGEEIERIKQAAQAETARWLDSLRKVDRADLAAALAAVGPGAATVEDLFNGKLPDLRERFNQKLKEIRAYALAAALTDEQLAVAAAQVIAHYNGNTEMIKILTRKPPRESHLMKMEIAALIQAQPRNGETSGPPTQPSTGPNTQETP